MKKLIIMMSSIVTVSPIISNYSAVVSSKNNSNIVENIGKTKYMKKAYKSSDAKGFYLYDSSVTINPYDNKPFGDKKVLDAQGDDETKYMDNVYLKSLQWDNSKKIVISSLDNLKAKDKDDPADLAQDMADYEIMENFNHKNTPGDNAIVEGSSVLNRYVNSGIAKFNNIGYIPRRETFFSELKNGSLQNSEKQDVITLANTKAMSKLADSDQAPAFSVHWYGVSVNLPETYMTSPVISYVNDEATTIQAIYDDMSGQSSKGMNPVPFPSLLEIQSMFRYAVQQAGSSYGNYTIAAVRERFLNSMMSRYNLSDQQVDNVSQVIDEEISHTTTGETPAEDVPESFGEDMSELAEESSEILEEAEEMTAATAEIPGIDIIVGILAAAIGVGLMVAMPILAQQSFESADHSKTNLDKLMYSQSTKTITKLNPALVNFKGEFSTTWGQESSGGIVPVYPKYVPEAIITPSMVSPVLNNSYNLITGSNDDFNVIMDPTTWEQFTETALVDEGDNSVNILLKKYNILNANLYLDDDGWCDIVSQLKYIDLDQYSVAVMHVVNGKVAYCNIVDSSGKTNMKYDTSAKLKESFIGTDLDHMDLIINPEQLSNLIENVRWAKVRWNDQHINGKTIPGIKDNKIDNPDGYSTYQEWFYNKYVKYVFWRDSNLDEKTIETFIDNLIAKKDKGFKTKENVAMSNNYNDVLDISSSILKE